MQKWLTLGAQAKVGGNGVKGYESLKSSRGWLSVPHGISNLHNLR